MKLLFQQRFFSWFNGYDIFDECGNVVFSVMGEMIWGNKLQIYDARGAHIGTVKKDIYSWFPRFEMYVNGKYVGCFKERFSFKSSNIMDFNGWRVSGGFPGRKYSVSDPSGREVAKICKKVIRFTDNYVIDVADPADALYVLMLALSVYTPETPGD